MLEPNIPVVTVAGVPLSLREFLVALRQRRLLRSLLLQAGLEQFLLSAATAQGVTVSDAELQQAADRFRQQHGLISAAATQQWLARENLTVDEFEAGLQRDLLLGKLKHHVTLDRIAEHFAARQDDFARVRLRQIVVEREDLAHELLTQLREGSEFADLAREFSQHLSRAAAGLLGTVARRQLPADIATVVFKAGAGDVVGPLARPEGFYLFLVESIAPPELDGPTTAVIRQELFDGWLNEQLKQSPTTMPLMDAL